MLSNWLLLLLLLPGWLVPSGLRVPVCACLFSLGEDQACCAAAEPVESSPSCCATDDEDEDAREDRPGAQIDTGEICRCSIAVPDHAGGRAVTTVVQPASIAPAPLALVAVALPTPEPASRGADPVRPRGPSPGGANKLPLRL